jgi:peptidyl-prolyl cis-trans isomerase SurA
MKSFFSIILIFFFFLYFDKLESKINNNIELKVGKKIITTYEIKNKILSNLLISNQDFNQKNINKFKKQAIDSLIQKKIKETELDRYNFKVDQKNIETYLNSISSNKIEDLKEKFRINNISFELFLEEINIQFKWQQLIMNTYSKNIKIDKKIIEKEINEILTSQSKILEFRISEIEILINNDETDQKKIENLKNTIKEIGFDSAAQKFSTSSTASNKGDLGWINSKSLSKEMFNVINNLETGQISKPIFKQGIATIFKLTKKRNMDTKKINVDNLKRELISKKTNDLFNLYSQSLISTLQNSTLIEYVND